MEPLRGVRARSKIRAARQQEALCHHLFCRIGQLQSVGKAAGRAGSWGAPGTRERMECSASIAVMKLFRGIRREKKRERKKSSTTCGPEDAKAVTGGRTLDFDTKKRLLSPRCKKKRERKGNFQRRSWVATLVTHMSRIEAAIRKRNGAAFFS